MDITFVPGDSSELDAEPYTAPSIKSSQKRH